MAVVQISRIQVRRGQKYSNTGVPQLSSAEFAWAVDSQELFIGNGSIAEGAPYVGNTKILTEHDNLIDLLGAYQFAVTDPSISGTVARSLQQKLDEYVSVLDFGAVADGFTDCSAAFQKAIDQLFLNFDPRFKRRLIVPPGNYRFTNDLFVPSTAFLQGENKTNVILNFGSSNIRFKSINETLEGNYSSSDHPQDINLSNMTLEFTSGQFVFSGVTDSSFNELKFTSTYSSGDDISSAVPTLFWQNDLAGASANRVVFRDCTFEFLPIIGQCIQTMPFETVVDFDTCKFSTCGTGIKVDGVSGQSNKWKIYNSTFDVIANQAFVSPFGYDTQITECTFRNCGNGTNTAADPINYVIQFGEGTTNVVKGCSFDRLKAAGVTASFDKPAIQEVFGGGLVQISDRVSTNIFTADSYRPLAVFSLYNSSTTIEYTLTLGTTVRKGTLTIGVEKDRSNFSITDNYQHASGDLVVTEFNFDGVRRNNLPGSLSDSTVDTLVLTYVNPSATGATGSIAYSVSYSV